jgi:hypothetical protein
MKSVLEADAATKKFPSTFADPLKDHPPDYFNLVRMKEDPADPSDSHGSRSSLGGGNNYTKEQLLSAVQVSQIVQLIKHF